MKNDPQEGKRHAAALPHKGMTTQEKLREQIETNIEYSLQDLGFVSAHWNGRRAKLIEELADQILSAVQDWFLSLEKMKEEEISKATEVWNETLAYRRDGANELRSTLKSEVTKLTEKV